MKRSFKPLLEQFNVHTNVCIYLMIENDRQIAQKEHIGAQIELRAKLRVNI